MQVTNQPQSSQLFREIFVDNFCGGGGTSTGFEMATGRQVDIAINHDPAAISMHKTNHPNSKHFSESVWDVVPREAVEGQPVALCWGSPDCRHHSRASGGKPKDKNIRGLMWVLIRWAATVRPRIIAAENVPCIQTWGRLGRDNKPDPRYKGETFQSFIRALERQGYKVEHKELTASDYGAPTSRTRWFLIARRDGLPIKWPKPTHGHPLSEEVLTGKLKPYRTSGSCVDWTIPSQSIFERKKDLVPNTCRRLVRGIERFCINTDRPYIPEQHPVNRHFISRQFGKSVGHSLHDPSGTITANGGGKSALVSFIAQHYGGNYNGAGASLHDPLPTITTVDHNALVQGHFVKLKGTGKNLNIGFPATEPMHTITSGGSHFGEVRTHFLKYFGTNIGFSAHSPMQTVTSRDRFAGVSSYFRSTPLTEEQRYKAYWIARFFDEYSDSAPKESVIPAPRRLAICAGDKVLIDIEMRMLRARELFNAQGFPETYIIDRDYEGNAYGHSKQVARCGNAVPPQFAEAIIRANLPEHCTGTKPSVEQLDDNVLATG